MLRFRVLFGWVAMHATLACSAPKTDWATRVGDARQPVVQQASEVWIAQGSLTTQPDRQLSAALAVDGALVVVAADAGVPAFERADGAWHEIEPIALPGELDFASEVAASDGSFALLVTIFSGPVEDHRELWLCRRQPQAWSVKRVASDLDLKEAHGLALAESLLVTSMRRADGGRDVLAFERSGDELGPPGVVYAADPDDDQVFAVSGSQVLVGLRYAKADNGSEGVVKAFSRVADAWQVGATLSAAAPDAVNFGRALAATPERVIVGTGTGEAYVFDRTKTGFTEPARLEMPDRSPRPVESVAISEEAALVGSAQADVDGLPGAGVAYMAFGRTQGFSASQWLAPDHVLPQAGFGHKVALAAGEAFVSASGDLRPQALGRVFVYGACESDSDCSTGTYCSALGTCASQKGVAEACDAALDCRDEGCRVCQSLHCVDGFCCDRVCDAQCEACGEPGAEGTCRPASGAVRGERPACSTEQSECSGACDGNDPACSFPTPGTPCASQCEAGVATPSACDGTGSCVVGSARACGGYACDGSVCGLTCRRPEDCSAGFACLEQTCVPLPELSCSEDGQSSRGPTGTSYCAPYRCDAERGVCRTQCEAADDCDSGYVCDAERHICTLESHQPSSGGCGCRLGRRAESNGAAGVAFALAAWLRRARRKRGRA